MSLCIDRHCNRQKIVLDLHRKLYHAWIKRTNKSQMELGYLVFYILIIFCYSINIIFRYIVRVFSLIGTKERYSYPLVGLMGFATLYWPTVLTLSNT